MKRTLITASVTSLIETLIASLITSLITSAPLSAEEVTQLEGVTATATRTARSQFDTPDSVGVVDMEDMERLQPGSLGDVLKNIPGVDIGGGPRALAQQPTIRGLSGDRILITLDGARQNFNSGHKGRVFVEPELLKRVEVLRGAGSAVWGSNAMGGVIAMTTKDAEDFLLPDEQWGVRLRGGFQNANNERLGSAILFGRLGDQADILLSGSRSQSDDIRLGGGDILEDSAEDVYSTLTKFNWRPAPGHRLKLSRQYHFESGEVPVQADAVTSPTAVLSDRETEVETNRIGYGYDPASPWIDVNAAVYSNPQTIREKRIGTDGRLDVIDFETRGVELRNSSVFQLGSGTGHRLSYGIETYQDTQTASRGAAANTLFPDAEADFLGVYLQDEIQLRGMDVIPGVRLDTYESRSEIAGLAGSASEISERQLSPKLGLIYPLSPDMNVTLNVGKSFRAPSFQELYISGVHFGTNNFVPNTGLQPETGVSREIGLRYRRKHLWGGRDSLHGAVSVYDNRYEDFIEGTVTATTTSFDNVSKARIRGVEIEGGYRLAALALEADAALTVTRGDDLTGDEPLTSIPGDSLVLNLNHALREDVALGLRGSFNQRQDRVVAGQPETPGYSTYDVYATWLPAVGSVDDLKLNIGVDNLFDKRYRRHLSTLPEAGRNLKISLTVQF